MDYILQLLSTLTDDPGTVRLLFLLTIMSTVFILGLGLIFLLKEATSPYRRRFKQVADQPKGENWSVDNIVKALRPLSPYILPKADWERSKTSSKLVHAGFRSPNALTLFYTIKSIGAVLLPFLVFLMAPALPGFSINEILLGAVFAGFMGLMLPNFFIERVIERRKRQITNGFPDAIDLMVVCTEAGLGINAALQRVAEELTVSYPQLADELALVNAEVRAGVDRSVALKNLAKRTDLQDIKGLVAVLSQSMRFGTSIADTLRVYSEEFRDRRMQKAEEEAAKIGTKMIFPLVFCLWPGFFVVVVGPAILGVLALFRDMGH